MTQPQLRTPVHPGQADTLVHFCGRGRPSASARYATMTPQQRLTSILDTMRLDAHNPFGADHPVVCLSESDPGGVEALIRAGGWDAWGVVLRRQWAWDQGGGPVWYVRDDVLPQVRGHGSPELDSWLVRTDAGSADWLHEREWRIPCEPRRPFVDLGDGALVAVLVADPAWEPPLVHAMGQNPMTGDVGQVFQTNEQHLVPRWYWDGNRLQNLPPVEIRVEPAF